MTKTCKDCGESWDENTPGYALCNEPSKNFGTTLRVNGRCFFDGPCIACEAVQLKIRRTLEREER